MRIERYAWLAVSGAIACGCSGEIDESSTVLTEDGRTHAIADLYHSHPSSRSAGPVGTWTLYQLDVTSRVTRTRVRLHADGRLDVSALEFARDDELGDHVIRIVTVLEKSARLVCAIGDRWRMVDDQRMGMLFICPNGVGREAVFRWASPLSFPSPNSRNIGVTVAITLDTVGAERASTPSVAGAWPLYRFGLAGAQE